MIGLEMYVLFRGNRVPEESFSDTIQLWNAIFAQRRLFYYLNFVMFGFHLFVTIVMLIREITNMKIDNEFDQNLYRNCIFMQFYSSLGLAGTQFWSSCEIFQYCFSFRNEMAL